MLNPLQESRSVAQDMEQPSSLMSRAHTTSGHSHDGLSEVNNTSHTHGPHRKKRIRKSTNDSAELGPVTPPSKRLTRSSPGSCRARGQSVPTLDPDAHPGEDLDPTIVTMAAICEDTGQGRVSSKAAQVLDNHAAWKRSNKEKRARMRATMEAKKYGRDEDTEERSASVPAVEPPPSVATPPIAVTPNRLVHDPSGVSAPEDPPETGHGFDYNHTMATSRFNVQVRIGPNGETIVDEESLFVDRAEEHETDNYVHVEESDATKFVNSGSYSKKFRGTRWTAEETDLFYAVSPFLILPFPGEVITPGRPFLSLVRTMN
jgi:transcription factor TFIIIB component B''